MKKVSVASILNNTYTCLPFEGLVKAVIGTPAPNAQMMVYGSPGSQKSTFVLALCAYLQHFGKVCYKALEEGESLTFQEKVKRIGNVFDPEKVILEDEVLGKPGEFNAYSFVVIDSATVIGIEAEHIAAMKKAYPNTMFIYVYQCTKDGKFRGSNEIEHEVDIALIAEKGMIKQQKNRCGGTEECSVQEMIDFVQAKSKPISGFLGKIEDEGDVPGLSRVDTYWRKKGVQSLFDFDNPKIHRGADIDVKYKYLFGETEENGYTDIEEATKTLCADFGIRGFEFGKWTTGEDRINYLKAATITLSDLAYLMGFKKIGLSKLSICFGSRGVPKASGHFQPNELYINLSRYSRNEFSFKSLEGNERKSAYIAAMASRGLNSLVHEFGHYVDRMYANSKGLCGMATGEKLSFLQESIGGCSMDIDRIIATACGYAANITPYGNRLIEADTQRDAQGAEEIVPYYQLRAEVFARIFEKWAAVKLKKNGYYNIFFAKLKHDTDDLPQGGVYMSTKEFEAISGAMDKFMQKYGEAVQGKGGKVAQLKKKDSSKVEAPKVEAPKAEAPKVEAPKAEAPKVEVPKVEVPKVEVPRVEVGQRWWLRQTLQNGKGKLKTLEDIIVIKEVKAGKVFYKTEKGGAGFLSYNALSQYFSNGNAKLLDSEPKVSKVKTPKVESQKSQTKSADNADFDKVYRLPLSTIYTDTKRFQNRDTEYSKESVNRIVSNFDANKLDPIVVWKDSNGKVFVLSGHSRFEAHKQLKKATIPARYFQGTEAEAKEFSRVHANRTATSEGLMADIRAFKFQRDELKRTKTELQKEWANYHKLEAYSFLNPKGKFLENLESKASGSFPYLEMRAQWVGNLRKMYPLLTNLHENEMFEYLYFDKKGSEIDKELFINAVQMQATRLDFDPEKPLKLGKKVGTDARADTSEAQARLRQIDLELKDYAAKRRVANTQQEKQAIDKFLTRLNDEKALIEKNIGIVMKTQNALFGIDKTNYMALFSKAAKKQQSYKVGDFVVIKSTWGKLCYLFAKITKIAAKAYYTDLQVVVIHKGKSHKFDYSNLKIAASSIIGKVSDDVYKQGLSYYKRLVNDSIPNLPMPTNWTDISPDLKSTETFFSGVKSKTGKKTALSPYIEVAQRLVKKVGKRKDCETKNILAFNAAMKLAKSILNNPSIEDSVVDMLKKEAKKQGVVTLEGIKSWNI